MVRLLAVVLVAILHAAAFAPGASAGISKVGSRAECSAHDAAVAAGAEQPRRIALSMGNGVNAGNPLPNAVNDSRLIATTLTDFGWEVVHHGDLARAQMMQALESFADKVETLCPSDVALFYFSGYGFEIDRISYIFPTDLDERGKDTSKTREEQDAFLAGAVSLKDIGDALRGHSGPKIVILDTCRDNPFQATRPAIANLAPVRLPDNTLYAYSAEPGDIALDEGPQKGYGPYAWALSRAIRQINGSAEVVFRQVRTEVIEFTSKKLASFSQQQRPFVESTLTSDVYLGRPPEAAALTDARKPAKRSAGGSRNAATPPKRIALVIANGDYASIGVLKNPPNDAKAVAATLRRLGFEVFERNDSKLSDTAAALAEFGRMASRAEWALIYFAGHGIEIGGRSYLLPVDVKLERDVDADVEAVPIDKLMALVDRTAGIGLVVLDACRNNPFERSMRRMERRGRDARTGAGLGRIEIDDDSAVLVAYSARHGTTAEDGDGDLSPFAEALLQWIDKPGIEINMVFRKIRDEVMKKTSRRQQPFIYGSLPGREYYLVPPRAAAGPPAAVAATAQ